MSTPLLTPDTKPAKDCADWTFNPTYEVPGVWITVGDRSIHLSAALHRQSGGEHELRVSVYAVGHEAGDPIDVIETTFTDPPMRTLHR